MAKGLTGKGLKDWTLVGNGRRKRPIRKGKRSVKPGTRRLLVTDKTHDAILEIIQGWPLDQDLSWGALMKLLSQRYGGTWTRQAIAKHSDLQGAFTKRQEEIRKFKRDKAKSAGKRVSRTRDEEVAYLKKQLELVNRENADLKQRLEKAEARMTLMRHNAFLHRVLPHQLDEPFQENDRGRSDKR
ncbi:hypothetical protein ACVJGC_008285 [Bradyrhizobium diazoefficiens]